MSIPFFNDLNKDSNDILNKGFTFGKLSVDVQSKKQESDADTTFKVTANKGNGSDATASFEGVRLFKERGLTVKTVIDADSETGSLTKKTVELNIKDTFMKGLSLLFNTTESKDLTHKVKASYVHDNLFSVELDGNVNRVTKGDEVLKDSSLLGTIVGVYDQFKVGLSSKFSLQGESPITNESSLRLGYYPSKELSGSLLLNDLLNKEKRTVSTEVFFRLPERKVSTALSVKADVANITGCPTLTTGVQYELDNATTLKAKYNRTPSSSEKESSSVVGVSLKHQLNDNITANVGFELEPQACCSKAARNFGLSLNVNV